MVLAWVSCMRRSERDGEGLLIIDAGSGIMVPRYRQDKLIQLDTRAPRVPVPCSRLTAGHHQLKQWHMGALAKMCRGSGTGRAVVARDVQRASVAHVMRSVQLYLRVTDGLTLSCRPATY